MLLLVSIASITAHGQTVTLYAVSTAAQSFDSAPLAVGSNQVARVSYFGGTSYSTKALDATMTVALDGVITNALSISGNLPVIAGPATIQVSAPYPSSVICTVSITDNAPPKSCLQTVSSTAVVIPSDTNGPVTIALESSADMVTWNAAQPGTYGVTTTNRFFRVRATR